MIYQIFCLRCTTYTFSESSVDYDTLVSVVTFLIYVAQIPLESLLYLINTCRHITQTMLPSQLDVTLQLANSSSELIIILLID